jgi:hypothetical protein
MVENPWFTGEADVSTYTLPELLGTKSRAHSKDERGLGGGAPTSLADSVAANGNLPGTNFAP